MTAFAAKSKLLFRGRVFSVTCEEVVEPGGVQVTREVVRHAGSAVVIPQRDDGRLLLIRQFRLPSRGFLWEAVAGRLDAGESPLDAARRELAEEAGLGARQWASLGFFYPSPGYVDERMWLFLARGLRRVPARPEPDERIRKRWFRPQEIGAMVHRGLIHDAKTIIGYFLLRDGGFIATARRKARKAAAA